MTNQELAALAGVLEMVIESDKFHLQVAKALLSAKPLTEQQRVVLLKSLAKRESRHEQVEALVLKMKEILKSSSE